MQLRTDVQMLQRHGFRVFLASSVRAKPSTHRRVSGLPAVGEDANRLVVDLVLALNNAPTVEAALAAIAGFISKLTCYGEVSPHVRLLTTFDAVEDFVKLSINQRGSVGTRGIGIAIVPALTCEFERPHQAMQKHPKQRLNEASDQHS